MLTFSFFRELRLVESLDGLCERILEYNIHKERTDSTRFAKGMSQTFQTLHGLVLVKCLSYKIL